MSITFACGQCGKTFTLDDRFAGKKGQCKGCGALMLIPENNVESVPSPTRSKPAVSAARPAPEPVFDAYGFDDVPATGGYQKSLYDDDETFNSIPPRIGEVAPKPRKSKARKKSRPSMSWDFSGGGRQLGTLLVVGIMLLGGVGGVLTALRHQGYELPDWIPGSQSETAVKKLLTLYERLNDRLKRVVDVPSAAAASPDLNNNLRELVEHLRKVKVMKDTKSEVEFLKGKYVSKINETTRQVIAEITRICEIPGAGLALNIGGVLQELEVEENEINRNSPMKNGLNPPNNRLQFMPPQMPNFAPPQQPNFNPPQGPTFNPGQPPNPGQQPGNMNRFGPNRGRPNVPGPRFGRRGN